MFIHIISILLLPFSVLCMAPIAETYEQRMITTLKTYIPMDEKVFSDLYKLASSTDNSADSIFGNNAFFRAYPNLQKSINYISLGDLPTPIYKADKFATKLGFAELYVKQDGLTGKKEKDGTRLFGGNKVRKLEFLLADALAHKARTVITFGCAGSNHALATARYAKLFGIKSILMLKPQHNSQVVRRNLLLDLDAQAKLTLSPTNSIRGICAINECYKHKQKYGTFPYIIPTGGSCPLGILGFVNAAFELKEQIAAGVMPEPDRIYVPLGSAGTTVGLLIGLKAAGLKSKVIAVAVEPEEQQYEFQSTIVKLYSQTVAMLHNIDATFPKLTLESEDFDIIDNCAGQDYALFTPEAVDAMQMLKASENIVLDGVYTGKAFAGLLQDITKNKPKGPILFWNTFCSDDFTEIVSKTDYKKLPIYFHRFFEEPVQELDRS